MASARGPVLCVVDLKKDFYLYHLYAQDTNHVNHIVPNFTTSASCEPIYFLRRQPSWYLYNFKSAQWPKSPGHFAAQRSRRKVKRTSRRLRPRRDPHSCRKRYIYIGDIAGKCESPVTLWQESLFLAANLDEPCFPSNDLAFDAMCPRASRSCDSASRIADIHRAMV